MQDQTFDSIVTAAGSEPVEPQTVLDPVQPAFPEPERRGRGRPRKHAPDAHDGKSPAAVRAAQRRADAKAKGELEARERALGEAVQKAEARAAAEVKEALARALAPDIAAAAVAFLNRSQISVSEIEAFQEVRAVLAGIAARG